MLISRYEHYIFLKEFSFIPKLSHEKGRPYECFTTCFDLSFMTLYLSLVTHLLGMIHLSQFYRTQNCCSILFAFAVGEPSKLPLKTSNSRWKGGERFQLLTF